MIVSLCMCVCKGEGEAVFAHPVLFISGKVLAPLSLVSPTLIFIFVCVYYACMCMREGKN